MAERGTILVVDDEPGARQTGAEFLASAGYEIRFARGREALDAALADGTYDAAVIETDSEGADEIEYLGVIKRADPTLEVIVITEQSAGDMAMLAISRGAASYLHRPVRLPALLNRVRAAITTRAFHRHTRHLIAATGKEQSPLARHLVNMERLLRFDREIMSLVDYRRVLDAILGGLLDMTGASIGGVLLIRDRVTSVTAAAQPGEPVPAQAAIRDAFLAKWEVWGGQAIDRDALLWYGMPETMDGPIGDAVVAPLMVQDAFIGGLAAFAAEGRTLHSDAAALVPIVAARAEIVVENAFMHEHTKTLATTDALTGLVNRRAFRDALVREFERTRRIRRTKTEGGDLSVIMLDVDNFKHFNDTYGHPLGDRVLKMVGTVLMSEARRATDIVARYGGEEFIIVAPETSLTNARHLGERIRRTLESTAVESTAGPLHVTASFGVSCYPTCNGDSIEDLVSQADDALYAAKRAGKNRVMLAPVATDVAETATARVSP